jgi:hypothetical protein
VLTLREVRDLLVVMRTIDVCGLYAHTGIPVALGEEAHPASFRACGPLVWLAVTLVG